MKSVFNNGEKNSFNNAPSQFGIEVKQSEDKHGLFTVIYGLQVTKNLTYSQACTEIGACILHNACCEGLASNEGDY